VSALRLTLVALLVASTALFAVGVSIERSERDTHDEAAAAQREAGEPEGAHDEEGEAQSEPPAGETRSVWAILDVREVAHQLDDARDGEALIAMTVAVLHVGAAAVSGHLARTTGTQTPRSG